MKKGSDDISRKVQVNSGTEKAFSKSSCAALLLLCWKEASAGIQSEGPISQHLPDFPCLQIQPHF